MDTKNCYTNGMICLNCVLDYLPSNRVEKALEYTFFNGFYNEVEFNTICYYQQLYNIAPVLKLVAEVCALAADSGLDNLKIRVDTLNASNLRLPPYITTELAVSGVTANIGFKELVIPIYKQMDAVYPINLLKGMKANIIANKSEQEIIEKSISDMEPVYSFPVSDTDMPFIFIDTETIVKESKLKLGAFSTTKQSRTAVIGEQFHIETITDKRYYKEVIPLRFKNKTCKILGVFSRIDLLSNEPTLNTDFVETKRRI